MKKRLTESHIRAIIKNSIKSVLKEDLDANGEPMYMSNEDIANQYSNFNVVSFDINPLRYSDGWDGTIELEFPNADDVDYDSYKVENFFVYDHDGERIAFENWYPHDVEQELLSLIRKEIQKRNSADL